jgi:hypothetical protein
MISGFNQAVSEFTLARLEISAAHPRIIAPPVIDRLGVQHRPDDSGRVWRFAVRQVRLADTYVRTGASAVARRHGAWARLIAAFAEVRMYATGIELLHGARARARRKPST